nr:MAG TPA: hypothetical protein [Caudoviricetes sp.]
MDVGLWPTPTEIQHCSTVSPFTQLARSLVV